jgi:hypothetical protein
VTASLAEAKRRRDGQVAGGSHTTEMFTKQTIIRIKIRSVSDGQVAGVGPRDN